MLLLTVGPLLCTSQLRMLGVPVAVMLPACYRLALLFLGQSSTRAVHCSGSTVPATGAVVPWDSHFLKELSCHLRMAVHSMKTLQPHVHRFDGDASPPMSVELLQLYRSAKESPVKLIMFKAKRLG